MSHLLKVEELVVRYGPIEAIKGLDMVIEAGQIVAILGANGAGKSTLIKTIGGVVKAAKGAILYEDIVINNTALHKRAGLGIITSPEGRLIFKGLTVEENLKAGAYSIKPIKHADGSRVTVATQISANFERVYHYFPILKERRRQQASTLSGGEQQMLAIGRALMASPRLLLLDEPSLGLAPLIVKTIFEIIKKISEEGTTILIVEQNAYQTLKIADYAYVMELGRIKQEGTPQVLLQDDALISAYLGGSIKEEKV